MLGQLVKQVCNEIYSFEYIWIITLVDIAAILDSIMPESPSLSSLKASDFALFGASWWPRAKFDRLKTVTYLATWV